MFYTLCHGCQPREFCTTFKKPVMQSGSWRHRESKKYYMRVFIACLFFCSTATAQINLALKDSSIVKTIDLPATEPFDTSHSWKRVVGPYVYIISDKDIYEHFSYETMMKFYQFNFADYHILGEKKNNNEWIWVMRENKKAFTEVPVTSLPGHIGYPSSKDQRLYDDTLVKSVGGTTTAKWYTTGHGDCHAWFTYSLVKDKFHPVLLLKENNYWGGCRAGGWKPYTLSFSMPEGILYTFKNTILMEKYKDGSDH